MIVRGTVYYLRLRVPRHLESRIGRTHFTKSLGTGLKSEAVRRARIEAAEFERRLMAAEGHPIAPPKPAVVSHAAPTSAVEAEQATALEKTFDDLFRLFLADPAKRRTRKTEMHYENLAAVVECLWGLKAPLRSIDRDACRELLETFRWLPSNSEKRFPKLSVVQAATMARDKKLASVLSPATVNGYMTKLRTLLNFALNEGWIDRNPARGLRVVDPVRRRDKRLPFTLDQLRLMFDAPLYRGCVDDWFGYAVPGTAQPRRGRFWVPLIALFSGMRLNEVCQLDVADVQHIEGVDCFFVSAGAAAAENDKRLKTASSERFIPVHPMLREIGFMRFVAERRHAGGRKLFPELQMSSTGYYSDPFSKWFRRFLAKAGATRPKTCFHSYRHNFRDSLREARIDHEVSLALGGWASSSGKDGAETAAAYGRGYRLPTLLRAIEQVRYPGLDLNHLTGGDQSRSTGIAPNEGMSSSPKVEEEDM